MPVQRENYCIGVPFAGTYTELFSTDAKEFGGNGVCNGDSIPTIDKPMHGYDQSVSLCLPPLSTIYLKCKRKKPRKNAKKSAVLPTTAKKKTAEK